MSKPHHAWNKGAKRRKHANRGSRERSWRTQIRLENQLAYRRRDEPTIDDELAELDEEEET